MREIYTVGSFLAYLQFRQYINNTNLDTFSRAEFFLLILYNFIYYMFLICFICYLIAFGDFICNQLKIGEGFISSQLLTANLYFQKHSKNFFTISSTQLFVFFVIHFVFIAFSHVLYGFKPIKKKQNAQRELLFISLFTTIFTFLIFSLI